MSASACITSIAEDTTAVVLTDESSESVLSTEEYLHACTLQTALRAVSVAEVEIDIHAYVSEDELQMIAKTVYGESRGSDIHEQAAVIWCILNRVDYYGGSVADIITAPYQFLGYRTSFPVEPEMYDLAVDVVTRYVREKNGATDVGRVLPPDYLWFSGDMKHNYFRNAYIGGTRWNFSYENPYIIG